MQANVNGSRNSPFINASPIHLVVETAGSPSEGDKTKEFDPSWSLERGSLYHFLNQLRDIIDSAFGSGEFRIFTNTTFYWKFTGANKDQNGRQKFRLRWSSARTANRRASARGCGAMDAADGIARAGLPDRAGIASKWPAAIAVAVAAQLLQRLGSAMAAREPARRAPARRPQARTRCGECGRRNVTVQERWRADTMSGVFARLARACWCAGCTSSPASPGSAPRSTSSGSTTTCSRPPTRCATPRRRRRAVGRARRRLLPRARSTRSPRRCLPRTLHWFYWEAYSTWLSGFALLCLLYFLQRRSLPDRSGGAVLSQGAAVAIAWASASPAGWSTTRCAARRSGAATSRSASPSSLLLSCVEAWGLCHLFSGRGAFMLFGSALGTIMVANVLFVIIPGQRELVRAQAAGQRSPIPRRGCAASSARSTTPTSRCRCCS